jgi:hypothetical protein
MLDEVAWQIALYAILSLTIARMLPVALALLGTGARRPEAHRLRVPSRAASSTTPANV